jgi:hypothetical protein
MNKGTFTYALLQYRHSQILGEVLNIGLVAFFSAEQKLVFIYPDKLLRLRFAYPNLPEKTIKSYLKYFEERVADLNQQHSVFSSKYLEHSLECLLNEEFLAPDSSSLQFGNFKTAVLYASDTNKIIDQLYNLYFSVFQVHDTPTARVDESILLKKYTSYLKTLLPQDKLLKDTKGVFIDYAVNNNDHTSLKFEIAWKATFDLHLVKPISFDLLKADAINRKAYQYFGQFADLEETAEKNNYLFDVILAKPKKKGLTKAYDNAIRLLEKPNRVKLIEQEGLNQYAKETVANGNLL